MTPKQADKLIASKAPATVRDAYGDVFTVTFVARDRRMIDTACGARFERSDLQIVTDGDR